MDLYRARIGTNVIGISLTRRGAWKLIAPLPRWMLWLVGYRVELEPRSPE